MPTDPIKLHRMLVNAVHRLGRERLMATPLDHAVVVRLVHQDTEREDLDISTAPTVDVLREVLEHAPPAEHEAIRAACAPAVEHVVVAAITSSNAAVMTQARVLGMAPGGSA